MSFIIGHEGVCTQLERILQLADIPQSFLFGGPKHVGKQTVAAWFAYRLLGLSSQGETTFSDLVLIEPEKSVTTKQTREKAIAVQEVRSLKQFLSRSPGSEKYRIAIINQAEKLSPAAADALLKVLEEPPKQSVLMLLTSQPQHLPSTILSRTVAFSLRPVSATTLRDSLPESKELPQFFLDLGLPGLIIDALSQPENFLEQKECLRKLFQISKLSQRARIEFAEYLSKNETETRDLLEIWTVGILFQARTHGIAQSQGRNRYVLLHSILTALRSLSRNEGSSRSILERLLVSCP